MSQQFVPGYEPAEAFHADDGGTWHRVHPVSPWVRGWVAVLGVMLIFGRNSLEETVRDAVSGHPGRDSAAPAWIMLAVLVGAVVVFGGIFFLSWFFTKYQVTDQHVRVNSGFIFRQQRQARIDRVQAIDVVQPLLARLAGLAELKFDVADSGKSAMKLSFLKLDEAKRLRAAILASAAGTHYVVAEDGVIHEAPEQEVLVVPPLRIALATIFSALSVATVVILAGGIFLVVASHKPGIIFLFFPALLAMGAMYWRAFTKDFNFRLALSPDGIRLHYGMLETRAQTIPPGRIQAVAVKQNLLWRIFGWYHIQVNVAGYGDHSGEGGSRSVLLPVGTKDEVFTVLGLVFPDPGMDNPFEVFDAGLTGSGETAGFVHSPGRAAWLDPLAWRRTGFFASRTAVLCRHGFFTRQLQVVPHERTQSLRLYQGPVMRILRLANFELHSTPGPVKPLVRHLDLGTAQMLFDAQALRAATARRLAGSFGASGGHANPANSLESM